MTEKKSIPSPLTRRRQFLTLVCVSAPSFMLQLDANIVAVSLPSIGKSLGAGFSGLEWVITAYTLAFASLLLPAGTLADRYGRKKTLIAGLLLFTAASFVCGAAPDLATLIAARTVQGAGAALQLSAALATLSQAFHGDARARAFAFWGSVVGIGMSLGPVAGGLITQMFGWQWAFYINLPFGVLAIALILPVIVDSKDPQACRIDGAGVVTFSGFLFLMVLALISGNRDGWTDWPILAEAAAAALFLILFILAEKRQARPMLDFSFFRQPTYLGANIAQFAFAAGLLTMLTFMPVYFQDGLKMPPRDAGLMMLPMALPLFIVPRIVTSLLAHRLTGRALLTIGLALVSLGLAWMAASAADFSLPSMLAAMLVAGLGAGLLNGETTKVGMIVIPPERAGMASGISGTIRFTGIVIGFAALGVVLFTRITAIVGEALPARDAGERLALAKAVASGHFPRDFSALALRSFGGGYATLLFAAALLTGAAAAATWLLVRAQDTAPLAKKQKQPQFLQQSAPAD